MPFSKQEFLDNLNDPKKLFFSYAVKISSVNFTLLLEYFVEKADDVFFYNEPENKISFLSFDCLTRQSFGFTELDLLENMVALLKNKLISNHSDYSGYNLPSFIVSSKFPIKRNSEEWKHFGDVDLIVPKIILYQNSDTCFLIANQFSESFVRQGYFNDFLETQAGLIYNIENKVIPKNSTVAGIAIKEDKDELNNWTDLLNKLFIKIPELQIDKVVISRRVEGEIINDISWKRIIDELNRKYPSCTNFLYKSSGSVFFGSTPEVLIKFNQRKYSTEALAGSIKRGLSADDDKSLEIELLNSNKNINEHNAVVNFITSALENFSEVIDYTRFPEVKKLPNIQHLQTNINGTLKSDVNILQVIKSMFPTPAVCGIPKIKSLKLIEEIENFDRGLFTGMIGWFNNDGYGEFFVSIRSALVNGNKLYAYAGCGIVDGSDSIEEFEETKLKLKPILSLFNNAD
ncbi:MAG: isochorismate synthase [Ignavibacterium sp.]|jgi:menaquinone-specific isochorismate synthase|nr:isochorismate synthase [Ignavibacterium sp.]